MLFELGLESFLKRPNVRPTPISLTSDYLAQ